MNLQQLRYFQAIAQLESYTKASRKLLIAQPSLSHSIADLEAELNAPLFYKIGRGIRITEYGERFLIHVNKILSELDLATSEIHSMLNSNSGKIRMAVGYTLQSHFIPDMINRFHQNPENHLVQFEFIDQHAAMMENAFHQKVIDLGFGARIPSDKIEFYHLFDEELIAIVPNNHPLAVAESVTLPSLLKEPLISYTRNCGTRYCLDELFERFHLTPHILQEAENEKMIAAAVSSGLGVGIIPRVPELQVLNVTPLVLESSALSRPLYLSWPKNESLPPFVRNFRDYVIARMEEAGGSHSSSF